MAYPVKGQREDPVRLMRRRIIALILLVLVGLGLQGVWKVYWKQAESASMRSEAEAQLAAIKAREGDLRGDIAHLKSDQGIETVLREEYELAHEGEGVIVIVGDEAISTAPQTEPIQTQSFWDRFSF